jgi:uncharacterized protein YeaO (DUF488 family)
MPTRISEYAWGEFRLRGEGLRISCTRYLPRGIRKQEYARKDFFDVWLPTLAPSRKLIGWAKRRDLHEGKILDEFFRRYRLEMRKTDPCQVIRLISKLVKKTPVSIGCSCNHRRCHRFELLKFIRAAAVGKF